MTILPLPRWEAWLSTHRHSGRITALASLLLFGIPACSDAPVQPEAPGIPVPAEPVVPSVPAPAAGLRLDGDRLAAAAFQSLAQGDRILVAAGTASAHTVADSQVQLRDTTVAGIDGEGLLHALSAGHTWLVWPNGEQLDSADIVVTAGNSPNLGQTDYQQPAPPAKTVDVRFQRGRSLSPSVARSWKVSAGGDLQAALDEAAIGDEVVLESGAVFTGNFVLPSKPGADNGWVVVRAENVGTAPGVRMTPAFAATAPRIVTPNQDPAIRTAFGARKYRLEGIEVAHAQGALYNYGIVVLGRGDETALSQQPSEIVLDRMYIHGSPTDGTSRCIAFNGRSLAVIDSWISECHAKGNDAQGIGGWNGGGPFLIENNHIEASGQGVMFGGADPFIAGVSPSDITIRRNYFFKPMSWARGRWTVKATFELKHGKRVLFENNVLENHWIDAQTGFAILLQTLADNNRSWSWTTVQDVMVRNNIIRNSTSGANVLSRVAYNGGTLPTNPTSRVAFVNNLWLDVGHDPVTGEEGRLLQLLGDLQDATMANNTFTVSSGRVAHVVSFDGPPGTRTTLVNNVFPASSYGIWGSGKGAGSIALNFFAPGSVVTGNVIPGQSAILYPPSNFFPAGGVLPLPLGTSMLAGCSATAAWRSQINLPPSAGVDCAGLAVALGDVVDVPPG